MHYQPYFASSKATPIVGDFVGEVLSSLCIDRHDFRLNGKFLIVKFDSAVTGDKVSPNVVVSGALLLVRLSNSRINVD